MSSDGVAKLLLDGILSSGLACLLGTVAQRLDGRAVSQIPLEQLEERQDRRPMRLSVANDAASNMKVECIGLDLHLENGGVSSTDQYPEYPQGAPVRVARPLWTSQVCRWNERAVPLCCVEECRCQHQKCGAASISSSLMAYSPFDGISVLRISYYFGFTAGDLAFLVVLLLSTSSQSSRTPKAGPRPTPKLWDGPHPVHAQQLDDHAARVLSIVGKIDLGLAAKTKSLEVFLGGREESEDRRGCSVQRKGWAAHRLQDSKEEKRWKVQRRK
ncbi:hypothetical protein BDK51DRAFT_30347, partial [Blyttiomyces helicus]